MVLLEEHRLSFIKRLEQSAELKFWDDMNISILFGKIEVHFSPKDSNCTWNLSICYSLSLLTPVL